MPTKKNFLGAQQNYNPKNGEYEPALTGKNGKPVEDADGDGKKHESKFSKFGKEKEFTGEDFLSEEHLDYLFNKFGGDENKVLDAVRADPEYQKSEITNSDLQGIVEVHTMKKSFDSINAKRMGVEEKPKYQNISDLSSSVKKELKEKGFNTKGISVRGRNVGYSDALDITIKDPNIDIDEVRKIVNKHESYERDASGDILQGGNRYVNVKYEYGLFDSIGEENKEEASKLIEQAKSGNGSGIELGNKHYLFHDKKDGETFIHSNEYGMTPIYSPESLGSYLYQIKKFGRIVRR